MFRGTVLVFAAVLAGGGCTAARCRQVGVSERPTTCARNAHDSGWSFRSTLREQGTSSAATSHRLREVAQRVTRSVVYITTVPLPHNTAPESPCASPRNARAAGFGLRESFGMRVLQHCARSYRADPRRPLTTARYGGTGIILTRQGAILTSAHVVENASDVTVTLSDGSEHPVVRIVTDPVLDLAVLHVEADHLHALTPANHRPRRGTAVIALAGPKEKGRYRRAERVRIGSITDPSKSLQDRLDAFGTRNYSGLIETNAVLDPGYSGGPLLDTDGHLIGINVAAVRGTQRHGPRGYAIPFGDQTREALARLLQPNQGP